MLDFLKRHTAAPTPARRFRELLFGDVPLSDWAGTADVEPWASFQKSAEDLTRKDAAAARDALSSVLALPGLESRHYLQAWSVMRSLGVVPPPEEAKRVLGVVVDVPVDKGADTLAAYADRSARYLNHDGSSIVWDDGGTEAIIDARVGAFLDAGRTLVAMIGPWSGERPPLARGQARISILTPSGLHFGQGPLEALSRDPLAAPVFNTGTALIVALTSHAASARKS